MATNGNCHPCDKGKGYLLHMMGGKNPSDIHSKGIKWVVGKYHLLTDALIGGSFSDDFLLSEEGEKLLEVYIITLEDKLQENDIDFNPSQGITDAGWETFRQMNKKNSAE